MLDAFESIIAIIGSNLHRSQLCLVNINNPLNLNDLIPCLHSNALCIAYNMIVRNNSAVLPDNKTASLTNRLAFGIVCYNNYNSLVVLFKDFISIGK